MKLNKLITFTLYLREDSNLVTEIEKINEAQFEAIAKEADMYSPDVANTVTAVRYLNQQLRALELELEKHLKAIN